MAALLCRVELNKTDGIIISVENKVGGITHKVVLNGENVTTVSEGGEGTSTITQTPKKVSIDCKTFELSAETIRCYASKTTSIKGSSVDVNGSNGVIVSGETIKLQ